MRTIAIITCAAFSCAAQGAALDLQREIDAAAERGGGTVCVPVGEHEVKPFVLKSNVTLEFAEGATIFASTNAADYAMDREVPAFIYAENATNVAIVGKGTIDGRGGVFREPKMKAPGVRMKVRPFLLRFSRCRNLRLEGFTYKDSGSWGLHLKNCDGVKVKGVTCRNHCNHTNDGIDVESANVTIEDCDIDADDDALCFKSESDRTFPVTNIVVRNCRLASACNALKFGTGSYCDFRDVRIEDCTVTRPCASWRFDRRKHIPGLTNRNCGIAGMALEVVDGGRMENVTIRNIKVDGCQTPIFIRHHTRHEPEDPKGTYLRNILIENVSGSCDSRIASSITGVPADGGRPARRPSDITLRNISLSVPGGGTEKDAAAQVPEKDGRYPEAHMFNSMALPAYGFYVRHADRVKFENVKVTLRTPDARKPFVFDDCTDCAAPYAAPAATPTDEMSILLFGHSFGVDSTEHLPALLDAAGIRTVRIGRFVKANCSLQEHYNFFAADALYSNYTYYECAPSSTTWQTRSLTTRQVVSERAWDYVIFQNSLENEGRYETAQPYLNDLVAYVRTRSRELFGREPVICWNMFWPISKLAEDGSNSTLTYRLSFYGNSSTSAWAAYRRATRELMSDTGITNVVPTGTAIMNLRASALNTAAMNEFTRDKYHLSYGAGRYAAACAFFEYFIMPKYGVSVLGNSLRLPSHSQPVTDDNAAIIQQYAVDAVARPFGAATGSDLITTVDCHSSGSL